MEASVVPVVETAPPPSHPASPSSAPVNKEPPQTTIAPSLSLQKSNSNFQVLAARVTSETPIAKVEVAGFDIHASPYGQQNHYQSSLLEAGSNAAFGAHFKISGSLGLFTSKDSEIVGQGRATFLFPNEWNLNFYSIRLPLCFIAPLEKGESNTLQDRYGWSLSWGETLQSSFELRRDGTDAIFDREDIHWTHPFIESKNSLSAATLNFILFGMREDHPSPSSFYLAPGIVTAIAAGISASGPWYLKNLTAYGEASAGTANVDPRSNFAKDYAAAIGKLRGELQYAYGTLSQTGLSLSFKGASQDIGAFWPQRETKIEVFGKLFF